VQNYYFFSEKARKNKKSLEKIWWLQKKVVILHSQSREVHLSGVVIRAVC